MKTMAASSRKPPLPPKFTAFGAFEDSGDERTRKLKFLINWYQYRRQNRLEASVQDSNRPIVLRQPH